MIGYHLVWDLAYVGLLPPGSATMPLGRGIAAAIAAVFLALAGTSFALAHAGGLRWRPWAWRLGRITLAALAVTAVTFWATPAQPIRFGILHMIALAAVLSLPFLAAPVGVPVLVALLVLAVDALATGPAPPAAIWLGLGGPAPPASDFRPMFPWLAPVLLGLAAGPGLTRAWGDAGPAGNRGPHGADRHGALLARPAQPGRPSHPPAGAVWFALGRHGRRDVGMGIMTPLSPIPI